jgi:hypothetical protein
VACIALLAIATTSLASAAAGEPDSTPAAARECGRDAVKAAILSFVSAFNRGEHERLDGLFAPAPAFQWYSQNGPGQRIGRRAKDRDSLIPYFRARHAAGDRLGFVSFQARADGNGGWDFGLVLRRSVRAFRGGAWHLLDAKGAIECAPGGAAFVVMSLGGPRADAATARARS